jgi:hypothetical protein
MAYKRKYKKGKRIFSLSEIEAELANERYVFLWNQPKHPGWIFSMQLRTVLWLVDRGAFSFAISTAPDIPFT